MRRLGQIDTELEEVLVQQKAGPASSPEYDSRPENAAGNGTRRAFVYDLRINSESSQPFYPDVAAFSSRVVAEIERRAAVALNGYSRHVTYTLHEAPRSRGEYALELLTVGMAIRLYGERAASTSAWVVGLARGLFWLRRRSSRVKPVADSLRAGLFHFFFMRRKIHRQGRAAHGPTIMEYARLPRLIEWLQATGEFEQEWRRIGTAIGERFRYRRPSPGWPCPLIYSTGSLGKQRTRWASTPPA